MDCLWGRGRSKRRPYGGENGVHRWALAKTDRVFAISSQYALDGRELIVIERRVYDQIDGSEKREAGPESDAHAMFALETES